jgi:hypothetical protein
MFKDDILENYLQTETSVKSKSIVIAEWNMNSIENIEFIGNYRYRPLDSISSIYRTPTNTFDVNDEGNFYTNATYSDIKIDGGFNDLNQPVFFQSRIEKEQSLYSLEECFGKFRPRSGINKLRYFENNFSHHSNINMAQRPRYYMADRYDAFKYWTSYRVEDNIERGIAKNILNGQFFIDDASPFVVYKESVPANRLVVKMQTNVGDIDLGPFSNSFGSFSDPLYGDSNQTTPERWKIQILDGNGWVDIKSFNAESTRADGSNVIGPDGHVELYFGLEVPSEYKNIFRHSGLLYSDISLPRNPLEGEAFLVKENDNALGTYYIWINDQYSSFVPSYGWLLYEEDADITNDLSSSLSDVDRYIDPGTGKEKYRGVEYISGIRIVVDTMNKIDSTFDLIEMSPRLAIDVSDYVLDFKVTKNASDLGVSGLPVGQLLASTGNILLFDSEQAFNENNKNSLIHNHLNKKIKFKFYEAILEADNDFNYYVPIKTLYSENMPKINSNTNQISIELRDMFFYFESLSAPQIFIQNASVSYAISLLLDSVGFSNYVFKRVPGETENIIPDFFIGPDKSVAEILQDIAISTQTTMFFDEYNNFVMMSKNYMIPSEAERQSDISLYGNDVIVNFEGEEFLLVDHVYSLLDLPTSKFVGAYTVGGQKEIYTWSDLQSGPTSNGFFQKTKYSSNISEITAGNSNVYNGGKIRYTSRYLQKTYGSIAQAYLLDQEKSWVYKPALLWEIAGATKTRSVNGEVSGQSSYALGAMPLNSNLSSSIPEVVNHEVINNIIDFGEGVYWITRYNGYFYSNGEVIKYDAVQYSVPKTTTSIQGQPAVNGNVWITSAEEYENYFSKLSFNGKIYPTGLVRIYAEPKYEQVDGVTRLRNGPVEKHGRGQFGTVPVEHQSGLSNYWVDPTNKKSCTMDSSILFLNKDIPSTTVGPSGVNSLVASKASVTGIVKNFLSSSYISEASLNNLRSTQTGTVQSSALVLTGPPFTTTEKPLDSVSYVYKNLTDQYKHFGTRMRIVGKVENNPDKTQTPIGSTAYYSLNNTTSSATTVSGSSGGIAVMLNPETNIGYYFEIVALADSSIKDYSSKDGVYNVFFYKIKQKTGTTEAVPINLWSGLTQILVDSGTFIGQSRIVGEEFSTVYDLAVEYENIGSSRKFYLYVNGSLAAIVDDDDPLPVYNNLALFARGSAKCMFENVYAVGNNYSKNGAFILDTPRNSVFGDDEIDINESFRKYSMSGMIQSTYLSGISTSESPKYNMYFEEFGTIMREAAYFNIKYDKAYPALYAKLSPTFNNIKGYTTSGFVADAYGAEFLIFNSTDTILSLDERSENYLKIQGATFTQQSATELTVDEYFSKKSDLSNPEISGSNLVYSPLVAEQEYLDIKYSRGTYGKKEFNLDTTYIQSYDDADSLMGWLVSKITKPRKSVGVKIFSMPILQLGDIININYINKDGFNEISDSDQKFVIYSIEYSRGAAGPEMNIFLSEVS